jgi:hypothetical protein
MAKKQKIVTETVASAAPATPARAAKSTPRVTTAHHSKIASTEPVAAHGTVAPGSENPEAVIAKIAYGYWEARGCQGGSAHEDWVRAEQEYRLRRP